jgi:hypothetical protein
MKNGLKVFTFETRIHQISKQKKKYIVQLLKAHLQLLVFGSVMHFFD